jgi:hypothetical protein
MDLNMVKGFGRKDWKEIPIEESMHLIGRMGMESSNGGVEMFIKGITKMTRERAMER